MSDFARKGLFIGMAAIMVLTILVAVCTGVEVIYEKWMPPPTELGEIKISHSLEKAMDVSAKTDLPTHLPVHIPEPRIQNPRPWVQRYFSKKTYESGYWIFDPSIGTLPGIGRFRSKAVDDQGKLIFDVQYTVDDFHRRVVPGRDGGKPGEPLLFLGCSFTYGEGLEDTETLPAQVAEKTSDYRVYNYGFHGWSPGNILRRISKPGFANEIPERGGTAIYVFMDHHVDRLIGNLSLTRGVPGWRSNLPHYFLDENGMLRSGGMFAEDFPFQTWLYSLLAKSAFLNYYQIDIPSRLSKKDFKLTAAVIRGMKESLEREIGVKHFYVLIFPGSRLAKPLIHELDEAGISSIDYSPIDLARYVPEPVIPGDGHPSAAAQHFIAEQLARDLQLR